MKKTVTITKGEVLKIHTMCDTLNGTMNKDFIEFSIRNREILKVEKEILTKIFERTEEERTYLQKEWELISRYAVKKNGNVTSPIEIENKNVSEFNEEISKLKEENKEVFEKITQKNNDESDELSKEISIELHTINFKHIPELIDSSYYNILRDKGLVEFDEE